MFGPIGGFHPVVGGGNYIRSVRRDPCFANYSSTAWQHFYCSRLSPPPHFTPRPTEWARGVVGYYSCRSTARGSPILSPDYYLTAQNYSAFPPLVRFIVRLPSARPAVDIPPPTSTERIPSGIGQQQHRSHRPFASRWRFHNRRSSALHAPAPSKMARYLGTYRPSFSLFTVGSKPTGLSVGRGLSVSGLPSLYRSVAGPDSSPHAKAPLTCSIARDAEEEDREAFLG